jgi:membrane-associated protease RseP (regulator of RpoE activity)
LHHTLSGFSQIITGALSPIAIGTQLLQRLWQFVATESLLSTFALVASKEAAFNLLPLPTLNGGDIILNLVSLVKPISESLKVKLTMAGMLVMLLIWLCWLIALVAFLLK